MMETIPLTIVVSTYNRSVLLRQVLSSIMEQTADAKQYQVIIVDNNSSDGTTLVAQEFVNGYSNIEHVIEKNQGLSHARNRGCQEAKGEYVAYIDDDAKVPCEWVETALRVIQQVQPDVFGGPYYAFYDSPKPVWFQDYYASRSFGDSARSLNLGETLSGTNIVFRKIILEKLGGFDPSFGMKGEMLAYAEETDLQHRYREEKPDNWIYYDPNLFVYHRVNPEKFKMKRIIKQRFLSGRYGFKVRKADQSFRQTRPQIIVKSVYIAIRFALDIIYALLFRNREIFPYAKNYLYERTFRYLYSLGSMYEQFQYLRK